MTKTVRDLARKEAGEFQPPDGFAGGCKRSSFKAVCVHFKPDGSIGKIEEGCPLQSICGGERFKYN